MSYINKKIFFYFIILFIIFFLDRISKLYILNIAENNGVVDIYINQFINFILIWNSGIGFGLLSFDQAHLYNLITIIIILMLFIYVLKLMTNLVFYHI